jgi:hypothetical protein
MLKKAQVRVLLSLVFKMCSVSTNSYTIIFHTYFVDISLTHVNPKFCF